MHISFTAHRLAGRSWGRLVRGAGVLLLGLAGLSGQASAASILFIGNSFTFAWGSPVRYYRSDTVTDLNDAGIGGVPALFKSFAQQAALDYDVYLETEPGSGIDWHLLHRLEVIGQRSWDVVVMHGYSTLDPKKPGDPAVLVQSVRQMAESLRGKNPAVAIYLTSTWSRADQTYEPKGAWYGKPIESMALDVRAGYNQAALAPGVKAVAPVGEAWSRAMRTGVADANPYDGTDAGKIDLWAYDHYHASTYGYYLEALVVFGAVTGRDPRSLGQNECSAFELGLSPGQARALQQVAFEQLAFTASPVTVTPKLAAPQEATRCRALR